MVSVSAAFMAISMRRFRRSGATGSGPDAIAHDGRTAGRHGDPDLGGIKAHRLPALNCRARHSAARVSCGPSYPIQIRAARALLNLSQRSCRDSKKELIELRKDCVP